MLYRRFLQSDFKDEIRGFALISGDFRSKTSLSSLHSRLVGGEGGIRTPDTLPGMPVFKTGAINHSATSPHSFPMTY